MISSFFFSPLVGGKKHTRGIFAPIVCILFGRILRPKYGFPHRKGVGNGGLRLVVRVGYVGGINVRNEL